MEGVVYLLVLLVLVLALTLRAVPVIAAVALLWVLFHHQRRKGRV